jgi:long-subunit acyl-CoA synthetase (AMP-forming)
VRDPKVMQGYVNGAELTRQVLVDGWCLTADMATVDSDGFIRVAPCDPVA